MNSETPRTAATQGNPDRASPRWLETLSWAGAGLLPPEELTAADRLLSDPAQVGDDIATRWRKLLALPRWRLLRSQAGPARTILVSVTSRALIDPLPGEQEDLGDLANLFPHLVLVGVGAEHRELLDFTPPRGWSDHAALTIALDGSDAALLAALEGGRWKPATGLDAFILRTPDRAISSSRDEFRAQAETLAGAALQRGRISPDDHRGAVQSVAMREQRLARAARGAILAALDRKAVGHLRRAGALHVAETYNFVVLGGPARKWREQALVAFPLLISWALRDDLLDSADPPTPAQLCEAVDSNSPFVPALAHWFDVTKGTIRRLATRGARHWRAGGRTQFRMFVRALDLVPPEQWPTTLLDAKALATIAANLGRLEHALDELFPGAGTLLRETSSRRFLRSAGRRGWRETLDRLGRIITVHLAHAPDAIQSIARVVGAANTAPGRIAEGLAGVSTRELAEFSRRWHEAVVEFDRLGSSLVAAQASGETLRWPVLADPVVCGERRAVPLATSRELAEEGQALDHCVATYVSACLFTRTHLFSLRAPDGIRMSTVEVALEEDATGRFRAALRQHRAASNAEPGPECRRAATVLVAHLSDAAQGERGDAVERALQARLADRESLRERTQLDETERDRHGVASALPAGLLRLLAPPAEGE